MIPFDSVRIIGAGTNFLIKGVPVGKEINVHYETKGETDYESAFSGVFFSKDTVIQLNSFGYYSNTQSIPAEMKLVIRKDLSIVERTKH